MLRRFALATSIATYVLLLVGGLVHGTGSSLACPDWPLCHGQFFPAMNHGVEYEHSHRLAAGTVAVMTLVLSVLIFRDKRARSLRPLAIAAPIMVLLQAVLGGLTVIFKLPRFITLSHLTLSMCFFAVTIVIALRARAIDAAAPTSERSPGGAHGYGDESASRLVDARTLAGVTFVAILGQILLGGLVRHSMAGLACTTFPSCFGAYWPPASPSAMSERIHMLHRIWGTIVGCLVMATSWVVAARAKQLAASGFAPARTIRQLAMAAPILVLLQITLGVLSVTTLLHLPVVEAHLGVGALLLGSFVAMWTLLPAPSGARPTVATETGAVAV
jgi:heme A synthase